MYSQLLQGKRPYLVIVALSIVFFVPFLGSVHLFDWDEINFAEAAREMLVTRDYLRMSIDYAPFWEKPPLFIWMQALSMQVFGVNEFAARFPNALIGCVTLCCIFALGKRYADARFGALWTLAYFGSVLPHFYFRSGIIDPLFNLFIFLGVVFLARSERFFDTRPDAPHAGIWRDAVFSGVFTGLAVLTKGPVGLLLVGVTWFAVWIHAQIRAKNVFFPPLGKILVFLIATAITTSVWYGVETLKNGTWFLEEFTRYQIRLLTTGDAGHSGPWFYHPVVLLLGCFPASLFVLRGMRVSAMDSNDEQHDFTVWMTVLLAVVVIIFSIVKTKIVHYSSMAYFPLTFLAARTLFGITTQRKKISSLTIISVVSIGSIVGLAGIAFPLVMMNISHFLPSIRNEFTRALLQTPVQWTGLEWISGAILLVSTLVGCVMLWKKRFEVQHSEERIPAVVALFGATALFVCITLVAIAAKVEPYTQGTPISWYQSLQRQDCFVKAVGYKSYAQYFYTLKRPEQAPSGQGIPYDDFEGWLLTGAITKPAFFIMKMNDAEEYQRRGKNLIEIERKNGWVLMKREVSTDVPRQ